MMINYTTDKRFTKEQAAELFLAVRWVPGKYPERLYKALMNSSQIVTAWDEDRLVGLVRIMDDTELVAFIHYVAVDPAYQNRGIAGRMIDMVKDLYRSYLYINVMVRDHESIGFYKKHGFKVLDEGCALQYRNAPKYT